MKLLTKAALGALAVSTLALGTATPADARVVIGIGIGAPWGYPAGACGAYWYQPVYVGSVWYQGPICYRWSHGHRLFWLHGGWHAHAWHGPMPRHFNWGHHGFVRWNGHGHGHNGHGWHNGHIGHHGGHGGHNGHIGHHGGHGHNGGGHNGGGHNGGHGHNGGGHNGGHGHNGGGHNGGHGHNGGGHGHHGN